MVPKRRRPATSCMTLPDTRRLCVQPWRANRGRKTRFSVRPHMLREEMILILRVSAERATGITALNGRPARHRSVKRAPVLSIPKMFAMKHQCAVWADRNGTTTTTTCDDGQLHLEFTAAALLEPDVLTKSTCSKRIPCKEKRQSQIQQTPKSDADPMPNAPRGRGFIQEYGCSRRGMRIW